MKSQVLHCICWKQRNPWLTTSYRSISKGISTYTLHSVIWQVDSFPQVTCTFQWLFQHSIIVQRLQEQGMVNNIIQCFNLFQIVFVQEEWIIRISDSCYMLNQSTANNKYYYYHSVIEQTLLLQEITNQFCDILIWNLQNIINCFNRHFLRMD